MVRGQLRLSSENREDERQNHADDNAGHNREVDGEIAAFDPDVAGQTAEPFGGQAGPQQNPDPGSHKADDDQESSDIAHINHFAPIGERGADFLEENKKGRICTSRLVRRTSREWQSSSEITMKR
jgi:hypothetical protein